MCSTFSHIRQKAHSGKRTQHAWILKRAGLRHPSRDILLIPRASNRHKESHCAARATINCLCTRASPPLLPADQHGGALTFSLEVAVSVVLIKKLKGGGRRRSEREREIGVESGIVAPEPPPEASACIFARRNYARTTAPLWTPCLTRGEMERVCFSPFFFLFFEEFVWSCWQVWRFDVPVREPYVRSRNSSSCFSRIFRGIWKRGRLRTWGNGNAKEDFQISLCFIDVISWMAILERYFRDKEK